MNRTLIGTLAAVFVSSALIAAQDPQSQQAQDDQRRGQPAASQQEKTVTYTGCLEAGATAGTWVLTNATEVVIPATNPARDPEAKPPTPPTPPANVPPTGANPPAPPTPPASPATTVADVKGQTLTLQGTPIGFDLAANANHKIQVTGLMAEGAVVARTDPMPERGTPTIKAFTIRSAKSLADRCTGF